MKKTFVVLLSVLFVLSMAVAAFAVHPSTPSEMVSIGAKGKTQIVLGGSLRFRGDYRSDIALANASPIDMQIAAGSIDLLTPFALSAGLTQAEIEALPRSGLGDFDGNGIVEPLDIATMLVAGGVSVADAVDLTNLLILTDLDDPILDGELTRTVKNKADYDMRVRLWLDAYVSDNTMGRIHLETGGSDASDGDGWGCDIVNGVYIADTRGIYPEGNCKKDELRVLEAFIKHEGSGLLGIPAGLKIGHFPIQLGRGLFLKHNRLGDDVINLYADLTDNFHMELVYAKFTEGSSTSADDDTDTYTLIASLNNGNWNVNGDITYLRDKNFLTPNALNPSSDGIDLWNIGIRGNVDVGPNIYADIEFQTGSADDSVPDINTGLPQDLDFSGYAVVVGADFTIGGPPAINLNAEFGMGSGDDDMLDDDYEGFVTSLSDVKKYTYVYEYRAMTSALGTGTGISNTTYLKVGASGSPSPDLTAGLDLYWLQATEDVLGEDDIGWEIDGKVTYKIDTNFEYFIEGGILFAGDFYDIFDETGDADDMYIVRHGVQLGF
jgi:hypothetical protein